MRIAITGAQGQLGQALQRQLPGRHDLHALARHNLDVTQLDDVVAAFDAIRPDIVIHAAANTNVDGCEADPAAAFAANGLAARNVAVATARVGGSVVHISTNYVFDGEQTDPYHEWSPTLPISVYGASKLAGEQAMRDHAAGRFYVVRTAWLYAATGRNFVRTMLRLAGEQPVLRVVHDQLGQPTYVDDLARAIGQLIERPAYGVYHLTNNGVCSWFDWASATLEAAGLTQTPVEPIPATAFPRPARPPRNGALVNWNGAAIGIELRPWLAALQECVAAIDRA
jgi:dTDP-4-dehydrorhamnose reductase